MKFKTLILFFSFTVYTTSCLAWGAEGHRMVAKIAERYLAPGVKEKVVKCLGEDMEKAATWMDEIRSEKEMNYMKPFHYVNIPKGGIYQPTDKPNIVNELNRVREELKQIHSLSPETAAQDVKELIHLMGDISQPLHCGYGEDHGGNKVKVMYMNKKEETLHKVWDTELVKDYEGVMYNLSAQQKKESPRAWRLWVTHSAA